MSVWKKTALPGLWLFACLLILLTSAGNIFAASDLVRSLTQDLPSAELQADTRSQMYVYESERGRQLLGKIIQADVPEHLPDWDQEFITYEPNPTDISVLAEISEPVETICVLGTWCGDSKREVSRFWKILAEADNPNLQLEVFAIGRSSDQDALAIMQRLGFDESLRDLYDVQLVPTFIFSIGGREVGRIIETPTGTLEEDMVGLLTGIEAEDGSPAWH